MLMSKHVFQIFDASGSLWIPYSELHLALSWIPVEFLVDSNADFHVAQIFAL